MKDIQRIEAIRRMLDDIAPAKWMRAADGDGELVTADGPMGELWTVARFDPGASDAEKRFVVDAPEMVRFLLELVDRAIAKLAPKPEPTNSPEKNFAAECAMKCSEPAFKAYLEAEHGLEKPLTDDRCAQKVRSLCGVTSRSELNTPGRAADAWRQLRRDFDAWKRRERR